MEQLIRTLERDLKTGESQEIEFKADLPDSAIDLAKEIAAFATSNSGTMYLGVNDDGTLRGVEGVRNFEDITGKDEYQKRIQGVCRGIDPPIRVNADFLERDGKVIVRISIPKGHEPVYYHKGIPYLRDLSASRPATASEVRELHRKFFQKIVPVTTDREQEFLLNVFLQLSDARLLLSDYENHLARPDADQMLYDMGATGRTVLELSSLSYTQEFGLAEEMNLVGNRLQDLESFEFGTGRGPVEEFGKLASDCLLKVNRLHSRLKKRMVVPTIPDFMEQTENNIRMLKNEWKNAPQYYERRKLARLQEAFRRLGYTFHRLGNLPDANQYEGLAIKLKTLGENLRKISSWEYFLLLGTTNPIDKMKNKIDLCLSIADEIFVVTSGS